MRVCSYYSYYNRANCSDVRLMLHGGWLFN